jgi:hypothetical protein
MDSLENGRGSRGIRRAHFGELPYSRVKEFVWRREFEVYAGGSLGDSRATNAEQILGELLDKEI